MYLTENFHHPLSFLFSSVYLNVSSCHSIIIALWGRWSACHRTLVWCLQLLVWNLQVHCPQRPVDHHPLCWSFLQCPCCVFLWYLLIRTITLFKDLRACSASRPSLSILKEWECNIPMFCTVHVDSSKLIPIF